MFLVYLYYEHMLVIFKLIDFFFLSDFFFFIVINIFFFSTLTVITASNLIYNVFSLIIVFILSIFLLFVLGADFIAFLILIIYVGAIAILFLFVVMMVNFYSVNREFSFFFILVLLLCLSILFCLLAECVFTFNCSYFDISSSNTFQLISFCNLNNLNYEYLLYFSLFKVQVNGFINTFIIYKLFNLTLLEELSFFFYTLFVVEFILCGVILLVGIIGVLLILKFFFETTKKRQLLTDQLLKSFRNDLITKNNSNIVYK